MTGDGRARADGGSGARDENLRHDLLTPLNHIMGYSEMLQEEAGESGLSVLSAGVRSILDLAKDISALINRFVPAGHEAYTPRQLAELQPLLSALTGRIVEQCELVRAHREIAAQETITADLGRVRDAADRLAGIVERRLDGPATDVGQPKG
ncbi:MAG: hypothetical protein P4L84_08010 [Isosphaeraceae bacterium]|nr:hypothetical protein [Isosphaeraceae bacterium]